MALRGSGNGYAYQGTYDKTKFAKEYASTFAKVEKFSAASIGDLLSLLSRIEADKQVIDLRWTAYMLATALKETSHVVHVGSPGHTKRLWRNFGPTEEMGHGGTLAYHHPTKVKRLPGGDARVTEWAGGQWTVTAHNGHIEGLGKKHDKSPVMSEVYLHDDGTPIQYFGRGYVQLTWWDGYASAGAMTNRGLALLFNPELALQPSIAYEIMAKGFIRGKMFGNRRRLSYYFTDTQSDYLGARNMVNPGAKQAEKKAFAKLAQLFESVLMASRSGGGS
jgi:hypothetical protein